MKDIIRYKFRGHDRLILQNITLEQAKEWCSSPYTKKEGVWFDGFCPTGTNYATKNQKPMYSSYKKL